MGKREAMASTTTAEQAAVSGAIIEMYARQLPTGGTVYAVEVNGVPVAEGDNREFLAGIYLFLKAAPEPVIYPLVHEVMTYRDRTPLEV